MKIKRGAFFVTAGALVAIAWLGVAPGDDRPAPVVKPGDRVCTQDAECKLVEVPCTCGQQHLAANLQHYKRYERHSACTSAEISHCARVGASVPKSAVCRSRPPRPAPPGPDDDLGPKSSHRLTPQNLPANRMKIGVACSSNPHPQG